MSAREWTHVGRHLDSLLRSRVRGAGSDGGRTLRAAPVSVLDVR